jgi:hypothetical protein
VPQYLGASLAAAQEAKPKAAAKKESAMWWPDNSMVTDSMGAMTSVFERFAGPLISIPLSVAAV